MALFQVELRWEMTKTVQIEARDIDSAWDKAERLPPIDGEIDKESLEVVDVSQLTDFDSDIDTDYVERDDDDEEYSDWEN